MRKARRCSSLFFALKQPVNDKNRDAQDLASFLRFRVVYLIELVVKLVDEKNK